MYQLYFKSIIDKTIAFIALIISSPVFICLVVILYITHNGKPFFTQKRPGKDGKTIKLIKFCSMRELFDENGNPLPDRDRVTKVGQFIRSASLDELPQLINVLIGDMSLVGPRPLLMKYLPLYSTEQNRRHEVKPGITGWAQVNGRNALSWDDKFALDVYYVNKISFLLDLKIIMLTFVKIIKKDGVNASIQTTMTPFKGNK
ncbi:sugar transferase [Kaistella sp.]|uniref:sugar transferase n=1 Tax=Kaistella sp. TaxID=2782235 RepID=UPI003C680C07